MEKEAIILHWFGVQVVTFRVSGFEIRIERSGLGALHGYLGICTEESYRDI